MLTVSSLRTADVADMLVRLIASLDALDTRFLAIQSVEDWIRVCRADHAEERAHAEYIDLGGEA